jgi:hypothetical protein
MIKLRAKNFYTNYYSLGNLSPWSAESTFYSSDLPQPVPTMYFSDRTKTDATIHWAHLTSEADLGFSTINVYYLLWIDDCAGGPFS